jgi:glycosyltransferase involved in cell wall biosynthesis
MATCNGAAFLDDQLSSIAAQTYPDIDLWVSDSGSTDATVSILSDWTQRWTKGQILILRGPREGRAANFRSLIGNPNIRADYFAFADQHDLWEADKIAASVRWIEQNAFAVPSVFCSRTITIGQDGAVVGSSQESSSDPDFRNALVENIATGNTMLYNKMAHDLLVQSCQKAVFSSHDWWLYLIVTGAGGVVHHDSLALVRQRQLDGGGGWWARIAYVKQLVADRFAGPADLNMQALIRNSDLLTGEAREICDLYWKVRSDNFIKRLHYLRKSGVYRQTTWGQANLYLTALLRRL